MKESDAIIVSAIMQIASDRIIAGHDRGKVLDAASDAITDYKNYRNMELSRLSEEKITDSEVSSTVIALSQATKTYR
jgi:hypothetical protein